MAALVKGAVSDHHYGGPVTLEFGENCRRHSLCGTAVTNLRPTVCAFSRTLKGSVVSGKKFNTVLPALKLR